MMFFKIIKCQNAQNHEGNRGFFFAKFVQKYENLQKKCFKLTLFI